MVRDWKALIVGVVVAGAALILAPQLPFGEGVTEPPVASVPGRILADQDRDRVADDLESAIAGAPPAEPFRAIVLLREQVSNEGLAQLMGQAGDFSVGHRYRSVPGFAATLTRGQITALARLPQVELVEPDRVVKAVLNTAVPWFGVQKARTDFGVDGNADGSASYSKNDLVVAVIDTGIDGNHVDLDGGKILEFVNYVDGVFGNPPTFPNAYDDNGHGTHVSSIATGEGQGNAVYRGVAPGAALVGLKVLDQRGSGYTSDVNAAIDWVIQNKSAFGIEIVNLSLGISGSSDGTDSTSLLVNAAAAAGIFPAVAAGNEGPTSRTVGSPGAAGGAFTVGAMEDPGAMGDPWEDGFFLAYFSSRGPTLDGRIKPDLAAPGYRVTAAQAGTVSGYIAYSGTSMATPFVAGVAALMLNGNPGLSVATVKQHLMSAAVDWGPAGADNEYGAGRLDAYRAVEAAGGFSGLGPAAPIHTYIADSLTGSGSTDTWLIGLVDPSVPIAVSLIMTGWSRFNSPDFNMRLYTPTGSTPVATTTTRTRQDTLTYQPTATGTYRLEVYSRAEGGPYFFDLSAGTEPALNLVTDGAMDFGIVGPGASRDSTPSGINDAQTVQVQGGSADLYVETSQFAAVSHKWALGVSSGPDQVKWEYSANGVSWTTFTATNTLYPLKTGVAAGGTQNVYFRVTMPTSTTSTAAHRVGVRIVAVAGS